ncbi:hypothetical protein C5167_031807 [Papaver somniferum]|uniref:Enoyl reductase (ER) domain-containing protein n=1 Tax=Papaver somniferum TaxID=3469 RepID=A0A4Y7K9G7_PAPSO|nr:hypothetical protein C5167_031807 [Papaver somniferum]
MAGKLMRAVQFEGYGGGAAGLKHVEVPVPSPKKDEVLLKLEAASINPIDWKIQKGVLRPLMPWKFPYIPEEIRTSGGGFAEYAVASKSLTVERPPEVSAAEGAGLPVAGLTALQALTNASGIKLDGTGTPTNILITAASGGVGQYAVQLAKLGNSLGADEVLDYRTPEGEALKSPSGCKYDFVIHCATGIPFSTFEPNLNAKGKVIDITPGPSAMLVAAFKKLTFSKKGLVPLLMIPKSENLAYLVNLVKEGKLKTVVDSKHPLSRAEDAWAKSIEGHATGKIIVEP